MKLVRMGKSTLGGSIFIPPSKSQTLRAILFASLASGLSTIHGYLDSSDSRAMIEACRLLGAEIAVFPDRLEIKGVKITRAKNVIDAGNSGIVLRFCSAIGALASHPVVITGDTSICYQRPMKALLDGLAQLGVSAQSMRGDGYAPVIIEGPLKAGKAVIEGSDSQPVSALLIGAAFAKGPISIYVNNPGEIPWVALTLNWFDRLGISYENRGFSEYHLKGGAEYSGFEYTVPGDLSSAAFPLGAALVTQSRLTLENVDMNDLQGDKELIFLLQKMGARIEIDEERKTLEVYKSPKLQGISIDINECIDAITILAAIACYAEGETLIYNGSIARQKECNRIACIVRELSKMGADIVETSDGLRIRGSSLKGASLESYQDHRMAMSLSVAALGAEGDSEILGVGCVGKTFPSFFEDFKNLGAKIIDG